MEDPGFGTHRQGAFNMNPNDMMRHNLDTESTPIQQSGQQDGVDQLDSLIVENLIQNDNVTAYSQSFFNHDKTDSGEVGFPANSARSSRASSFRNSTNSSIFSRRLARGSVDSASTAFTQASRRSSDVSHVYDDFLTCVSRKKRSRKATLNLKYWCTSCGEGFGTKFDWKRHEETFQERREKYLCELCNKTLFLAKDFQNHHRSTHKCVLCVEKRHVESSRHKLSARTAWGCGFCGHLDTNWNQRCVHVANHFDEGSMMDEWKHSYVIFGLLKQSEIKEAWIDLLEEKQIVHPHVCWSPRTTGRAEGFPANGIMPRLQDHLEFFPLDPDLDARAVAQWAWNASAERLRTVQVSEASYNQPFLQQQSLSEITQQFNQPLQLDKELPPIPQPIQSSDQVSDDAHSFRNFEDVQLEPPAWSIPMNTIPENNVLSDSNMFDFDVFDSKSLSFDP